MSTLLLDKLLDPSSITIVGASAREGSPGFKLVSNLLEGRYAGNLFLVNPRYDTVLEQTCHKSVKSLPEVPDLAILIVPARILKKTLVQCSKKGIKVAVIMSGCEQPQELHRYATRLGMRLVGPYCAGLIRPHIGLNATYSSNRIHKGNLAVVSQSASLAAAMLDWAETSNVGFSAMLSTGQDTDISLSDLLDLLAEDGQTRAVIVYVERIKATRAFLSALSATARIKPVVLMRSSSEGISYCDALTRTGQIYSSDDVFQAALNRAGVVRIKNFSNLYAAARILSSGIRINGNRLAIISNASAPAMMAMERFNQKAFDAPRLDRDVLKTLTGNGKQNIQGHNPVLLRDPLRLAEHYVKCIDALMASPDIDAVLVIYVPDSRNDADAIAAAVTSCKPFNKPLLTSWMGDASVSNARETLTRAGIPSFRTPEAATDGFDFLHRYHVSQQQLLQLPNPMSRSTPANVEGARSLVQSALQTRRRVLDPLSTRQLMELFDIPVLPAQCADSLDSAIRMANATGYPVAMKLVSPNISYKAAVVSTQLNLDCDEHVEKAWSLIQEKLQLLRPEALFSGVLIEPMYSPANTRSMAVSLSRDPVFGPVIAVGVGGELTALMHERRVQLPPLNRFLIKNMLECKQFQVYLGAYRHTKAVEFRPLFDVMRRISELACELPEVFSMDINPLIISDEGAMAMDIHVVLEAPASDLPYQHLAIHPYPSQWVRDVTLKDGAVIQLRPIRPEDGTSLQAMTRSMSPQSRYFRFMHAINELSPQMLAQFTKLDYDRQIGFVATTDRIDAPREGQQLQTIIGSARYTIGSNRQSAEFAVTVRDDMTGKGLAGSLMRLLLEHARHHGLKMIYGDVLRSNRAMQGLMKSLGFEGAPHPDERELMVYSFQLSNLTDSISSS